jgi:copper chaperone
MITKILKVEGMTCQHCVQIVSESVGKVVGVQKVEVNLDQKEVTVEFDEALSQIEEISTQIVEAGFEVIEN